MTDAASALVRSFSAGSLDNLKGALRELMTTATGRTIEPPAFHHMPIHDEVVVTLDSVTGKGVEPGKLHSFFGRYLGGKSNAALLSFYEAAATKIDWDFITGLEYRWLDQIEHDPDFLVVTPIPRDQRPELDAWLEERLCTMPPERL